ncbi:hypothetical protein [Bacillus cereus]|uniref:hypothetical protein n=2 Tax=Bacillus cereus TaxID=1396 RepID=UPI00158F3AAD|nr:hypothetical protein [Bacillus cereus]
MMKKSKMVKKGYFVGEAQFEGGKTVLGSEQLVTLKELSRVLNNGQDDYLDGFLSLYSPKGLKDLLSVQVRTALEYETIDSLGALQAYKLIEALNL